MLCWHAVGLQNDTLIGGLVVVVLMDGAQYYSKCLG
jgi:hypothetical protein